MGGREKNVSKGDNAYQFVHHLLEHYNQIPSFLHLIQHTNVVAFESHRLRLLHHLKIEKTEENCNRKFQYRENAILGKNNFKSIQFIRL